MKEYRDIIDAVINIPLGDYYTATNGEEEWVAHPIQYSVDHLANSILLIS